MPQRLVQLRAPISLTSAERISIRRHETDPARMRIGCSRQEHSDKPSPRRFRLDANLPADVCLDRDDGLLVTVATLALSCFK
jgi:hypothetical protein